MKWMLVSQLGSSVKTSGQCDSSLLQNSALMSFLIVPLLKCIEECWWYCNQLIMEDFPHVYVTNHGDYQKPPKQYLSVKYQLPILSFVRAFFISTNVDTLHFVTDSQKCFAGVSPIALLLSGMQFVEFSTSVDAF